MKTIFIVDDMATNLMLAKQALEGLYKTYALPSAEQMFKLAEKITPDMILLDVDMPEMNGFEAMEILKKSEKFKSIPVIFLTARNDVDAEIKGFELGAIDFINKPFTAPILLKRLEIHIQIDKLIKTIQYKNEVLMRTHEAKDNILCMISHDLKNFINYSLDRCDGMVNNKDSVTEKNILSIQSANNNALKLLNDILIMNRMDINETSLPMTKQNINEEISNTIDNWTLMANQKNITVEYDIEKEQLLCMINEDKFQRAINNLFINAIKFTCADGRIEVKTRKNGNMAEISILDNGIGMDKDLVAKLFQQYTKAGRPGTHGEASTGLGLYIAKQIIDLHIGTIEVKSEVGKGSEFIIKLPIVSDIL